jgi:hypothetical protein
MTLTINKKDYPLHFGLDFIAHLDKRYHLNQNGFQLGQGMTYAVAQIELGNPLILLDLIAAATATGPKPKPEEIKHYVETTADIEELMNDFLSAFKTSPTTKFTMKRLGQLQTEAMSEK